MKNLRKGTKEGGRSKSNISFILNHAPLTDTPLAPTIYKFKYNSVWEKLVVIIQVGFNLRLRCNLKFKSSLSHYKDFLLSGREVYSNDRG